MPRIAGIDLARALAIGGMFVAHLAQADGGWWWIADGRSSALFALLAGSGLGFLTARSYPDTRGEHRHILQRAIILGLLGILLMFLGTPVAVILPSYAVMFALTIPFLGLTPKALLLWAGGIVAVVPPLVQALRLLVNGSPEAGPWIPGVAELATGYYPALSWLAYALVGLAVQRLPLDRPITQARLLGAGVLAATAGYGGGHLLTPLAAEHEYLTSLVAVEPHTDSGFEILGNIGACLIVISLSLVLTRPAVVRILLSPVLAAGSMALTLYGAHLVYIWALGPDAVWEPTSQAPLLWLIGGSLAFAWWWKLFFPRGPLEWALTALTRAERQAARGRS